MSFTDFIGRITGHSDPDFGEMVHNGAQVIDVRTPGEFNEGHITGSINIPLDQLSSKFKTIDRTKPVITCCRSGVRSGSAVSLLKQQGFTEAYNGGSWMSLDRKISSTTKDHH